MAAFGVPVEFPAQELYELLDAADGLACTQVLRCSKLFVKKMRDVVVEMINKDMYLHAIRIILAFELHNAFPLASTLTIIMEKVEYGRKEGGEGQASKERDEEELALLRAISKCVEDHKLCPSEFSSFSIAKRIVLLEERVVKPKQDLAGIKRKRTAEEDCVAI
uniref:FRIGIDA-like protein n=1 Tax=Arundo donax TaxID=35708 RepID=A0A0A9FSZ4_ARUDO